MKFPLPQIRHEQSGFEALVLLHAQTKDCRLTRIEIDMSMTNWFDADMCAAFGSILYRLSSGLNTVELTNIPQSVETILSKNGFLSNYGRETT